MLLLTKNFLTLSHFQALTPPRPPPGGAPKASADPQEAPRVARKLTKMMKKIDKTKNRTYSSFVDLVYTQQKSLFLKPPQTAKTSPGPVSGF